jgi:aconitate hydratase
MSTAASRKKDLFGARDTIQTPGGNAYIYRLDRLVERGFTGIERFPFSIKVLLEGLLRECDGYVVRKQDVERLAAYNPAGPEKEEIPFIPARVLLQDFTGVPAVVDLAAMRTAMARLKGDPQEINPRVPVHLVIDHSVQVDAFGTSDALRINSEIEFDRNRERYEFLRWGQRAFENFSVVPPASGICHQVNLEYIARGIWSRPEEGLEVLYPDTLVGTDSHTTMINGLGVLGWGVGGIEAEAVMLGQPIYMLMPEVIGFKVTGKLKEGVTATDLTLTVTQMLREKGVVGKFVEFYGDGLTQMALPDRATIANMAPEYGATMGFFPVDEETLAYMRRTGRPDDLIQTVEQYYRAQGLFRTSDTPDPEFFDLLELDLDSVEPSVAGPKRPQDRIAVPDVKKVFASSLLAPSGPRGFGLAPERINARGTYADENDNTFEMQHGDVVIASITSCTNTSNPSVMLGAGLVAKKAVERGLKVKPYVKTSLAPGSRVVTEYLREANLLPYLDQLGFNLVGYGCMTCIGNSGPLPDPVESAIKEGNLIVAGVLSGNRNFEGRIHQSVQANFLASPPLVVAYALAGTVDIDLQNQPIGDDEAGNPVFLRDIWPTQEELLQTIESVITPQMFKEQYGGIEDSNETWNQIEIGEGSLFTWDTASTYIQEPPFFTELTPEVRDIEPISGARVLARLGDSTTTDHISPAGSIAPKSPAGQYLLQNDVSILDFNSYGARRGNHEVMMRGTFANIRIKNLMLAGTEGGVTKYFPTGETLPIYDAAMRYQEDGTPLVILAGHDYGMGSSRDWAAKGTNLLGVKVVIAESFERIHRSNLVGMGVLPLQFDAGESAETLGLDGTESFDIPVTDDVKPGQEIEVTARHPETGRAVTFSTVCRLDTPIDVDYYRHGGILHYVLRDFLSSSKVEA